jgi:hypothetical protein
MKKRLYKNKYIYITVGVIIVALVIVGAILKVHNDNQAKISSKTIPVMSQKTSNNNSSPNGSTAKANNNSSKSTTTNQLNSYTNSTSNSTSTKSNMPLVSPSGTFVSNHYPDLSGKPYPATEESTCNTTPGASCYIKFIGPNGQVKSLPLQNTGNNGSTLWEWNINSAGFTVGKWQITAVASLNGSTKTTTDPIKLDIQE